MTVRSEWIAAPVCVLVCNDRVFKSRCGRVTPLQVASVIALLSAPNMANRGWYRGRNAFRPECRDEGFIFL